MRFSGVRRFCSFLLVVGLLPGAALSRWASADDTSWMTEEAMRAAFIGETLHGYYRDGRPWVASYAGDGRYEVREGEKHAVGAWYFRGQAFCFMYGPPAWPMAERCGGVKRLSANCYQFHLVFPNVAEELLREGDFQPFLLWNSRGWRQREPSTCDERPIA
jgi:hypothetical protein